ncbi:Glycosyl transferase, group 1 [Candidatus Rhodobacter oscarellae]|uniref:Glycosyl transferase, group 1 n=1 Tax=Candidatus Rhodobacter oscarellae TaxID=1675527 RepID=A0A0J9E7Q7_9RHOB|nr:glycosyltransferase family 1 protein [Candidatus Rhodobacter lobularis]KMW58780.1 Glycosyl transferase, group 1 [Candidatus Rhodobacter lobularis]
MPKQARCLDITRLISRVGRGVLTGVDRVELAYLRFFVAHGAPIFGLARTSLGYVLLDRDGLEAVLHRIEGRAAWGAADWLGRLRRLPAAKARAEADLRRLAADRCRRARLGDMLARAVPPGTRYLNVGHSNLSDRSLSGWNRVENAQVSVLVHDMIPLDFPEYQRAGTVARFEQRMRAVAAHADRVICISADTERRVRHWFGQWGREVPTHVAHIGVEIPEPGEMPALEGLNRPYFVTIGTIEPRKNHALLLDIWQDLGAQAPALVVAGPRGWENAEVFRRLDANPANVIEANGLDDGALAALIQNAAGLLFPTLAEGFGLPPAEALGLGTPVICSDLPVLREILGDMPIYANTNNMYLWKQSILQLLGQDDRADTSKRSKPQALPTWDAHFNRVLKVS